MSDLSQIRDNKTARWSWFIAAIEDPDFLITALFCTVGLLVSINVLHYVPDVGTAISQLN